MRSSAAERLAARLRARILEGEHAGGVPLREQHISDATGASRHTVRAALRLLADEGLVTIAPNRGAFVREFTAADIQALSELRIALEVEAARLALERHGGRLPSPVHEACAALTAACAGGAFAPVTTAHERLHHAIVEASQSPRLIAVHQPLAREMILFLVQLRPFWDMGHLAAEHEELVQALERDGPEALRVHITASTEALTTGLKF
jgi:DNA-binding GntR family transcriptional regulator